MDMSEFIVAKSNQLNADDLMDNPKTITITKVTASPESADQPVTVHYEGDGGHPLKPCKTVRRIMVAIWGKDASKYVGRSMTLYRDPTVSFGGMQVGGIRVSHMSHIEEDKTIALLVTRGRKAPFKVKPLRMQQRQAEQPTAGEGQGDVFGLPPVTDGPASPNKAEQWTNSYIENVKACEDIDTLMDLQNRAAGTLAKLKAEREDLHELAANAGTKRAGELQEALSA